MTKNFKKKMLKTLYRGVALFGACGFFFAAGAESTERAKQTVASASGITKTDASINTHLTDYFDSNVVYKLPEAVEQDDDISVIVTMDTGSIVDAYKQENTKLSLTEYVNSAKAAKLAAQASKEQNALLKELTAAGISYTIGERYDTITNGFEIVVKASDFEEVGKAVGDRASLILGETYEPAATEVVTNEVEVYDTGIFNSQGIEYQGAGVVVAVLDTGLDYTHSAFDVANFHSKDLAFTLSGVSAKVGSTTAAKFSKGLTGEDVYMNAKVPYAYDYADKDPDVLPINSEHGTHVAGIIAGNDDEITGVAPEAQLAIMKVFSDSQTGAKDSWILSALEDCVVLGVDVINMSLGSSRGFSREEDGEKVNDIYDSIKEAGISLIVAASNDGVATSGSEKNGSLPLTSNPDAGTVGAPSTYETSLSVASVDGVKTPYLLYGEEIIYFNEAMNSAAKTKDFVDDLFKKLGTDANTYDFEYVTIPGIGRASDYPAESDYYAGKIVLVKRGTTTFEDKVRVALQEKGAAGIIIYNNVSGSISMSVGKDYGAVCSISQDDGELLAAKGTGTIRISRSQVAGPYMSDFSSWGPTSNLGIKPEITAHGGEIYSAVPGGGYERMSGTSMAAPNQAGATALIRQYVKSGKFGSNLTNKEITAIVNQLMMSTADIVYNKNGLPYAVRKQGAGLISIKDSIESQAYIKTYDQSGNLMDKTKLELGDDKNRTGEYGGIVFEIHNVSDSAITYDIDTLMITEGVSETFTGHGEKTVSQEGYLLTTTTSILDCQNGTLSNRKVTVAAGQTAKVSLEFTISEADKQYIDKYFENGYYVEGFITLKAVSGATVDMNIPVLAFYGDWTEAPILDEEYYDTHKDELNAGLDVKDKLMADAYATRAIGGLYSDYISALGSYYFKQDPSNTQIAASKDRIAISNQDGDEEGKTNFTVSSIYSINAGLLRNVKEAYISIVEDSTGEEVFNHTEINVRKSNSSGSTMYPGYIDVDFSALEHNLKNNTRYTVTMTTYIDYGTHEEQKNARNVFTFPLYIDFEAPSLTDVRYYTEYDQTSKKTRLYADLSIYDNHYSMGMQIGQIVASEDPKYTFSMETFGEYVTPVYSSFNSTSVVTVELTDYISKIKDRSIGMKSATATSLETEKNNSFIAICYDYAMNSATYELRLPDEVIAMYFEKDGKTLESVRLSPNEKLDLTTVLNVYPATTWESIVDFTSADETVAKVVNGTLLATADTAEGSKSTTITAIGYNAAGEKVTATLEVVVLGPTDEGYRGGYTVPEVNTFEVTGYKTLKAYYSTSLDDREIGLTDSVNDFGDSLTLSMYPSESVQLLYKLDSYTDTVITYKSNNQKIATIGEDGVIVAQAEGSTIVTASVGSYSKVNIRITVKDPYTTNSMYLMSYKGLGGVVEIPDDRGITTIYSYAFSNYEYVEKDLENGDVIDEEDPYHLKQWYIGDDTITKVIIPEGVEIIESYAFAALTKLEEVKLPTTLKRIGVGAFYGCTNLKTINLENVQFINEKAFADCALGKIDLSSVVSIGNYTFQNCVLTKLTLPTTSQSVGVGSFYGNKYLETVTFAAPKMKVGSYAFAECSVLDKVAVNAAVISSYAFYNCSALSDVTLGKDVAVIGEYAFTGTNVAEFKLEEGNSELKCSQGLKETEGAYLMNKAGELILVAPQYEPDPVDGKLGVFEIEDATSISSGAFAGSVQILHLRAPNVTTVGDYAFAGCKNLVSISLPKVETIGEYAFAGTSLEDTATLDIPTLKSIGAYAFAGTDLTSVVIADEATIGESAFSYYRESSNSAYDLCEKLHSVKIGKNVTIGKNAFYSPVYVYTYEATGVEDVLELYYEEYAYFLTDEDGNRVKDAKGKDIQYVYLRYKFDTGVRSQLISVEIGDGTTVGESAFSGHAKLTSLTVGNGVELGNYAFFNAAALEEVQLQGVVSIGDYAFSGSRTYDYWMTDDEVLRYAYERTYLYDEEGNGEDTITAYIYSDCAPNLSVVDLTNAKSIGVGAFAGNEALTMLTLGDGLSSVSDYAFMSAENLKTVELPEGVTSIGAYAFYDTAITEIELDNVITVGEYAFARTGLTQVTLAVGATVGDGAFIGCEKLATVNNLESVTSIGAYAFAQTALTSLKLTGATYIGDFAFSNSAVTQVDFGTEKKLASLGENPFYGCAITTFAKEEPEYFNNQLIGTAVTADYEISATVKVIDGVLYQSVPNGLELVSYPAGKGEANFAVEEGVVRISARAFEGSAIKNVILPSTLIALGDKAFYGCEQLAVVTFLSYEAPILEEEYDEYYLTYEHLPLKGEYFGYEGLGIVPYYMWNITSNYNNFYFGANFVNYVGQVDQTLVMVKPVNGQHYDTFILSKYFSATIEGSNAIMESTLKVIAQIAALPMKITLEDAAAVAAARAAFEAIASYDQKALVTNLSKLTSAEAMIEYLEFENNDDDQSGESVTPEKPSQSKEEGCGCGNALGGIFSVMAALGIAVLAVGTKKYKVSKKDE
ncbi:MAG: leucine-rich repeat protein [Clostridia bacterium]|nr:leucine-rich repeat protein [Clostridia bacterium]